jgi:hypothetical protein
MPKTWARFPRELEQAYQGRWNKISFPFLQLKYGQSTITIYLIDPKNAGHKYTSMPKSLSPCQECSPSCGT